MAPLPELIVRPHRALIPNMVFFICSVTVILLTDPAICQDLRTQLSGSGMGALKKVNECLLFFLHVLC